MSAISMISHDLLSDIMLESASFDMAFTLGLAAVSERWRAVALGSRRLWARFRLQSSRDIRALPIFLARSEPVPLQIKIRFTVISEYGYNPTRASTVYERAQAIELLAHCAGRIRYLDLRRADEPLFDVLLATALNFDILEELVHDYDFTYGDFAPVSLSARQITRMELYEVMSERWDAILGHHLTVLSISRKYEPFIDTQLLRLIFLGCPKLEEVLLNEDVAPRENSDMQMPTFTSHMPAPALRRLDIQSSDYSVATIPAGLSDIFIPSITICIYDGIDFDEHPSGSMIQDLMRGMSPIVSITIEDGQDVLLFDTAGNERRMILKNDEPYYWDYSALWAFLVRRHGVQSTIRMISIGAGAIHRLSPAFSDSLPTLGPQFQLRVQFDETFRRDLKGGDYDEHGDYAHVFLACPPQSRVCLEGDWTDRSALQHMLALVRCSTQDVEICLDIVDDAATHDGEVKPDLLRSLREEMSQAQQCQWSLCTDCVSSAH